MRAAMISSRGPYLHPQLSPHPTPDQIDRLIGRRPLPHPKQLTRVLYIPYHDADTMHLPIYDIHDLYRASVGDTPISSTLYTVKLTTIQKPSGDGLDVQVAYLINFQTPLDGSSSAVIQRRAPIGSTEESDVHLKLASSEDENCIITMQSPRSSQIVRIHMSTSFPIPPSNRQKHNNTRNPFFTIYRPGEAELSTPILQWQIRPVSDGPLRYTLVDLAAAEAVRGMPLAENPTESRPDIKAIYHHVGLVDSLEQDHSEGILLLPEPVGRENAAWEGAVIASLLGLLAQVRTTTTDGKPKLARSRTRGWSLLKKGLPTIRRHSA